MATDLSNRLTLHAQFNAVLTCTSKESSKLVESLLDSKDFVYVVKDIGRTKEYTVYDVSPEDTINITKALQDV